MKASPRVLHLGLGRFHRAHQAWYFDRLNEMSPERSPWLISSWSMRSAGAASQMREHGLTYMLSIVGDQKTVERKIHSIAEAGCAPDEREALRERFLSQDLQWITLTITEKGYHLNPAGKLDLSDPQIRRDLQQPERPETAIGILAWGLRARLDLLDQPLAVVSCDNMSGNGEKLREAVRVFLEACGHSEAVTRLKRWIDFPNTMVDRIVPAGSTADVTTESFSQWVIEDCFRGQRPPLEKAGVVFCPDIKPFEERKLRLLNASHSLLAYGGILKSYRFVHEAIRDESLRALVEELHEEVISGLNSLSADEYRDYALSLMARFANSRLPHELRQIAMDGSKKLPERIFPSLRTALEKDLSRHALGTALALWIEYLWRGLHEGRWKIEDPLTAEMTQLLDSRPRAFAERLLSSRIFSALPMSCEQAQSLISLISPRS